MLNRVGDTDDATETFHTTGAYRASTSLFSSSQLKLQVGIEHKIPSLFYIRPEFDSYTLKDEYKDFLKEMKTGKIDFQVLELRDTHYGFVHKDMNSYGSDVGHTFMYFNQKSADLAFDKAKRFLKEKLN